MRDKALILNKIKEYYNFNTDIELADFLGVNKSTLSNWYKRNSIDYDLVFSKCEQIDKNWLLGSESTSAPTTLTIKETEQYHDVARLDSLKHDLILEDQEIFIYDISAAAGLSTVFNANRENIINSLRLPNIGKCDGAIFVSGNSMYPLIKNGDIIVFKLLNNLEHLLFGNIYIVEYEIAGDEYLVCKYLNRSEADGFVTLRSYNDKYFQELDIPMNSIRNLAIVKASVSYNNMY